VIVITDGRQASAGWSPVGQQLDWLPTSERKPRLSVPGLSGEATGTTERDESCLPTGNKPGEGKLA